MLKLSNLSVKIVGINQEAKNIQFIISKSQTEAAKDCNKYIL